MQAQAARGTRKRKQGVVISDKMDKTITVQVERLTRHSWLNKTIRRYSKFKAHDDKKEAKAGDLVIIEEARPFSKTKRWRLVQVIKKKSE